MNTDNREKIQEAVTGQAHMEEAMRELARRVIEKDPGSINARMEARFVSCNFERKEVILDFPTGRWQRNPVGIMHGGLIAVAFDLTLAFPVFYFAGHKFSPTVRLDATYIKPIPLDETLRIRASIISMGRTLINTEGKGYLENGKKLAVTATASYFNANVR